MLDLGYRDRVRYTLSHKTHGSLEITEPDGWDEDQKEYLKHSKYSGVVVKFSNSSKYYDDAADFINYIKDNYSVNDDIWLKKEIRDPYEDNWVVDYNGTLDLMKWETEGFAVKVKFNSNGLESELKARESEKVEIERTTDLYGNTLESLKTYTIDHDGRDIFLHSEFKEDSATNVVSTRVFERKESDYGDATIPVPIKYVTKSDELINNPIPSMYIGQDVVGTNDKPSISHVFYGINDRAKTINLKLKGSFKVTNTHHARIDSEDFAIVALILTVYGGGSNYNPKKDYKLWVDPSPKAFKSTKTAYFDFNDKLQLEKGDSLVLRYYTGAQNGWFWNRGMFIHDFYDLKIDTMTIQEDSFFEKTTTKVVLAHELGERLTEIITGRKGAFYCEYLGRKELGYEKDGPGAYKAYTCGHWIRGFDKLPNNDSNKYKAFTTTFKDFVEDLRVTENLDLGIEKVGKQQKINIKPIDEFYVNQVTIRLPYQISNVKRKIAEKHYYTSVLIGCAKGWKNEEAMGLDEYNAQATFITPLTKGKNQLKLITKYIYASYAAEFIRRKQKRDYPDLDHNNDKEIFVFDLKKEAGVLKIKKWQDDLEEAPEGVYSPETAYNLLYSPINLVMKNSRRISNTMYNFKNDLLRFGSTEGNRQLKTKIKGEIEYKESQDIAAHDLGFPNFLPEEVSFEHELDYNLKKLIEGTTIVNGKEVMNIYGLIEYINEKGKIEKGRFLGLKPNGKVKWKFLKAI
ncbi:conserved protein of unknown function [Tenacibaculum sp. 190524A02b]|uniref:hypothetical protein n=1 Tax=Tenacibaculum vairaonense TaxID=3137860 RepID=UPI0032B2E5CF